MFEAFNNPLKRLSVARMSRRQFLLGVGALVLALIGFTRLRQAVSGSFGQPSVDDRPYGGAGEGAGPISGIGK